MGRIRLTKHSGGHTEWLKQPQPFQADSAFRDHLAGPLTQRGEVASPTPPC